MPTLSGTVKDDTGAFASRMVRAYRRSDGAFVGQAVSDAVTGAYSIPTNGSGEHFVIKHDGTAAIGDPYWDNVVLAMRMDSELGFTDMTGKAVSVVGSPTIITSNSKFGGSCCEIPKDTTSNYLSIPASSDFVFGTTGATFSIQFWFFAESRVANNYSIFGSANNTTGSWRIMYNPDTRVMTWVHNGGATVTIGTAPTPAEWVHVEVSVSSGNLSTFMNGTVGGTASINGVACGNSTGEIHIGRALAAGNSGGGGLFDDVCITKGIARHTTAFTKPTEPFPDQQTLGPPTENAEIFDYVTPV